ncbi:MAG: DUF4910 domain-containing protein [Rhodobacterales bacterium]|nr:DUF4910 domain-containing protein [Rhodobacterales bacterium]
MTDPLISLDRIRDSQPADPGNTRWRAVLSRTWPLNRAHAGADMRRAYHMLAEAYPDTRVLSYPSGEDCGSWTAPPEWEVNHARLTGADGVVYADWHAHPLYLFTYSPAFSGTLSRQDLEPHLFSAPGRPDIVPFHFRNQYRHWETEWGFCLPHRVHAALPDQDYRVDIDTTFTPGAMDMVEQVHVGESADSLLLIGHFDHPAMANDGLVGCLAGHEALARLAGRRTRLTYRMLSSVEIVGSVFYAGREAKANSVREALFLAMPGADAPLRYATSFGGNAFVDRAARHVLSIADPEAPIIPFRSPDGYGNDEIAFDVAGINIPCGSLQRFPFVDYHSDRDTPAVTRDDHFEAFVDLILKIIDIAERNSRLVPRFTGLPCTSKPDIDLYLAPPGFSNTRQQPNRTTLELLDRLETDADRETAGRFGRNFNNLMNYLPAIADGRATTLDLAEAANVPFAVADVFTDMWVEKGLLDKPWSPPFGGAPS